MELLSHLQRSLPITSLGNYLETFSLQDSHQTLAH
jgi:hypothetical protein